MKKAIVLVPVLFAMTALFFSSMIIKVMSTATALPITTQAQAVDTQAPAVTATTTVSDADVDRIFSEAGIRFTPDAINTYTDESGAERCIFQYSNHILESLRIYYIQFPAEVKNFMCYNIWATLMSIQRDNAPFLKEKLSTFPIRADDQNIEIQRQMRSTANEILTENGQIPYAYWENRYRNYQEHTQDISEITFSYLTKDELDKLQDGLSTAGIPFSSSIFETRSMDGQTPQTMAASGALFFVLGDRLLFFSYDDTSMTSSLPVMIPDTGQGSTSLENLYNSLIQWYINACGFLKKYSVPDNERASRVNEWRNSNSYDPVAL